MLNSKMDRAETAYENICPFLGSWWDEKSVCRYASGDNRCYAAGTRKKVWGIRIGEKKPYRYVSKNYQSRLCLTGKYPECSTHKERLAQEPEETPEETQD